MYFKDCTIHIISKGMGPKRYNLFKNQIEKYGGTICSSVQCGNNHSHVVCDEDLKLEDKELKQFLTSGVKVVGTKWLSESIKNKELQLLDAFLIDSFSLKEKPKSVESQLKNTVNEGEPEEKKLKQANTETTAKSLPVDKPDNSDLINELNKLAKTYRSLGEIYRSRNYASAVSVIENYSKKIESYEEALNIQGITPNMAHKIGEILETGSLQKTTELTNNEKSNTVELFTQIWGVGPSTAENWFCKGYRTLDDIQINCNLTKMQQIGLKYFDDFQKPIPRNEVEEIASQVEEAAKSINPNVKVEICGSYRRGKSLCGDVDVVIFENNEDHYNLLKNVLEILTRRGFLNDEFIFHEASQHHKFLGICKLPGKENITRRLDIFIAPLKEYGPAMIHYTGSANFNIGLRQFAIKKGMHLSESALCNYAGKPDANESAATTLFTPTEESVFELLNIPYQSPENRQIFVKCKDSDRENQ